MAINDLKNMSINEINMDHTPNFSNIREKSPLDRLNARINAFIKMFFELIFGAEKKDQTVVINKDDTPAKYKWMMHFEEKTVEG